MDMDVDVEVKVVDFLLGRFVGVGAGDASKNSF
jgi:hypothetical protein